jgi:hypothetical protein
VARLRQRPVLVAFLYGGLSAAFCAPLFAIPDGLGFQDWDVHLFFHGAVLKSLVEYAQLPFWNPWNCGGNVLWQNPQVAVLSPVYPLALLVPLPLAIKLNILLHYWLALVGMHLLLTRVIGVTFLPLVVYLAAIFTFAGGHAMHLAVGHNNFLPAFYLPLQLFLFLRALRNGSLRDVLFAAALLALMILNGGLHIVPMSMAGLGAFSLVAAIAGRTRRPLVLVALFAAAGLAYAAPKLLPMTLFVTGDRFWDARTVVERPDAMTLEMIGRAYLDPYQTRGLRFETQRHGWYEYGNYIGLLAALLIAAAIIRALWDRRAPDRWFGLAAALTTLLLLTLSAGEFDRLAPAALASHVPLFSNFRIPSRYTIAVVLFGVVTAGWAFKAATMETAFTPRLKALIAVISVLATADLTLANRRHLRGTFGQAPIPTEFRWLKGPRTLEVDRISDPYRPGSPMFRALMSNQSFFNCYEVMRLTQVADADHPLVSGGAGMKIFSTRFSPNRVEFAVANGSEPARAVLNENFAAGWSSDAGTVAPDPESGKPSVTLTPGQAGTFAFTFRPPGLILGTLAGALCVGVSFVLAGRERS